MPQPELVPLPRVMRRPVVALRPFDSVTAALDTAHQHGVHHFPVCNRGHVVGVVCTCDLQEARLDQSVGELMRPAVTIQDDRNTSEAAQLMRAADVGSLLVTAADGEPQGIVTRSDLNGEPVAAGILEGCRCEACGSPRHLHRLGRRWLCFSCRERAEEPEAFDTGGGD